MLDCMRRVEEKHVRDCYICSALGQKRPSSPIMYYYCCCSPFASDPRQNAGNLSAPSNQPPWLDEGFAYQMGGLKASRMLICPFAVHKVPAEWMDVPAACNQLVLLPSSFLPSCFPSPWTRHLRRSVAVSAGCRRRSRAFPSISGSNLTLTE